MLPSAIRAALPDAAFAVPALRKVPIHDIEHVKLARTTIDRVQGLTDDEREAARQRIELRASELRMPCADEIALSLIAMSASLVFPEGGAAPHPNKAPFSGVLTYVDRPSDKFVGGTPGKGARVVLPRDVAGNMLSGLLGMAVDFTAKFDGHDKRQKIGVITAASIEGDEVRIEGFFYASDFPQETARIKREKEALGFSYEIQAQTRRMDDGLLQIVSGDFTGAAVLYKDKAAYTTTRLAAQAKPPEHEMTPEQLTEALAAAVKPLADKIDAQASKINALEASAAAANALREKASPAIQAVRDAAAALSAAGVGDAGLLGRMAAQMEADAARGVASGEFKVETAAVKPASLDAAALEAATKPLADLVASLGTQVTDLKAKLEKASAAPAPERKTLSAAALAQPLEKLGLTAESKPMNQKQVNDLLDSHGVTDRQARFAAIHTLTAAGLLTA